MANETKLRTSSELVLTQWSRADATSPRLAAPVNSTETGLTFTKPLKDSTGTVVTGAFLLGIRKSTGWTETCFCAAGNLSADGLSATVVRGIRPGGYDFTTGNAQFADSHDGDEPVFCNVTAIVPELLRSAIQGLIATGAANFVIGTDAAGTVTIKRSTGTGASVGFIRWYTTNGKAEFSNDGSTWIAIDDTVASVIFKVSSTDTSAAYAEDKIVAGTNIVITKMNTGGNEYLELSTTLPATVVTHGTYTPAYLTGDNTAESNYLLWGGTTDGSFAITINGVARTVSGLNFVGTASMAAIATIIQTAIRALTSSTETVVWNTDHFVISSVNTTSSSAITVTSATGSGTDISGAGAFGGLGCDTGHGVVTNKVLDETADANKVPATGANGRVSSTLLDLSDAAQQTYAVDAVGTDSYAITLTPAPSSYVAGQVFSFKAGTINTGACTLNVNGLGAKSIKKNYNVDLADGDILANQINSVIYDGTNFQLLSGESNTYDLVQFTRDISATTGTVNYNHSLGKLPKMIKFNMVFENEPEIYSHGAWVSGKNYCVYGTGAAGGSSTTVAINYNGAQDASVSAVTSSNFTLSWTKTGSPGSVLLHIVAELIA